MRGALADKIIHSTESMCSLQITNMIPKIMNRDECNETVLCMKDLRICIWKHRDSESPAPLVVFKPITSRTNSHSRNIIPGCFKASSFSLHSQDLFEKSIAKERSKSSRMITNPK